MSGTMRRNRSKWLSWSAGWRVRAVALALALGATGLMTAFAVAGIGAKHVAGDGGMAQLVLAQKIAQGTPPAPATTPPTASANAPVNIPAPEPPTAQGLEDTAAARDKILTEATQIEEEMKQAIQHTDKLRINAYNAKDIIRLNTVTSKLEEMRQIMAIAKPAFAAIREPGQDIFVMRAKLSTIRQGKDRMQEDEAAAEAAEGDSVDSVTAAGAENAGTNPNSGGTNPTLPANPTSETTIPNRPGQASPYR